VPPLPRRAVRALHGRKRSHPAPARELNRRASARALEAVGALRQRGAALAPRLADGDVSGLGAFLAEREALLSAIAATPDLAPRARARLLRDLLGLDADVLATLERGQAATRRALAELAAERRWLRSVAAPAARGAFVERQG
jgi:hypothetical protein